MNESSKRHPSRHCWGLFLVLSLALLSGCTGMLANLINVAHGNMVPANFTGLKDKKIAVVCVSNSEAFGPTSASIQLAHHVGQLIERHVDKTKVIDSQKIGDWIDRHDWDQIDFAALGRGVGAEMVVAIDLDSFSLHDGKTLYRGRADIHVVVYDLTDKEKVKEVFSYSPNQVIFPENGGHHSTETSEEAFRRQFLSVLGGRIARQFYAYDPQEDFARDASVIRTH